MRSYDGMPFGDNLGVRPRDSGNGCRNRSTESAWGKGSGAGDESRPEAGEIGSSAPEPGCSDPSAGAVFDACLGKGASGARMQLIRISGRGAHWWVHREG